MCEAESDLLRAVLESPYDDLPRLVYADWLEEHGQPERAEFIRHQLARPMKSSFEGIYHPENTAWVPTTIDGREFRLTYQRGFVSEIRLTMAEFMGGDDCRSCNSFARSLGIDAIDFCLTCKGTGKMPGLAKEIGSKWPITSVRFTDRSPFWVEDRSDPNYGRWLYWQDDEPTENVSSVQWYLSRYGFDSQESANAALSHAAVHYMRS